MDSTSKRLNRSVIRLPLVCGLAAVGIALAGSGSLLAWEVVVKGGFGTISGSGFGRDDADTKDSKFQGGATLENDPEIERLLHRAQQAVADKRYDLSAVLLQKVLDGSSGMLIVRAERDSSPAFQYNKSIREAVEHTLRHMKGEGLHVYRLSADGEARGLMAVPSGPEREAALSEVVRRFFLSSYGDEAAFELGCAMLDRYEFIAASRLFTKILEDHPDPSVSKEAVLVRLALANARLGDGERTKSAMAALQQIKPSRLPAGMLAMLEQEVQRPVTSVAAAGSPWSGYSMTLGTPARDGHMPSLSAEEFKGQFSEAVLSKGEPMSSVKTGASAAEIETMRRSGRIRNVGVPQSPADLAKRWEQHGWTPAGGLLIEKDRIYFKTIVKQSDGKAVEVARCINAITGDLIFNTQATRPQFDQTMSLMYQNLRNVTGGHLSRPTQNLEEVIGFGDRVRQSMSLIDGVLYQLEGNDLNDADSGGDQPQYGPNGQPILQNKSNWLAAYRTHGARPNTGGKLLWRRMGEKDDADRKNDVRFVNSPVPCGNVIVLPAREGGGLWLYGLDPLAEGKTVWRTFLCDEARGGTNPFAPVGLAVEGGDVYVASGCGVVFSVDGASGAVRWGTRYERNATQINTASMGFGANPNLLGLGLKGWDEDTIIARGRGLVLLPSDAEFIFSFDRRTGDLLWLTPKEGEGNAKYCLGVSDDALFVGGSNCVRRYNLTGGKLVWNAQLEGQSFGRGALTDDAVYMPIKGLATSAISKLDLKTGKVESSIGVAMPDNTNLGNLFTNGDRIFMVGPDRVSVLTDAKKIDDKADGKPAEGQPGDAKPAAAPATPSDAEKAKDEVKKEADKAADLKDAAAKKAAVLDATGSGIIITGPGGVIIREGGVIISGDVKIEVKALTPKP